MSEPPRADPDDAELVRAASQGDRDAFRQIYQRHVSQVYGVVLRLAGYDHARAEDLAQEAFVRAWQKLPSFRQDSALGTWLYRLAVNIALMDLRARRSDPVRSVDGDGLPEQSQTLFCAAESAELERAIAQLPPRARAVLVLHDVEGWKHDEIGAELNMATGSSKAQLHRARGLLRRMLGEQA